MTTRQFKRTAYCLGVMGLWLALATPAFAAPQPAQPKPACRTSGPLEMTNISPTSYAYTIGQSGQQAFSFSVTSPDVQVNGNCDASLPPVFGNTDSTSMAYELNVVGIDDDLGEAVDPTTDAAIRAALSAFATAPFQLTSPLAGSQSVNFTFTNSGNIPAGTYDLTVQAKPDATGVGAATRSFTIQVEELQLVDTQAPTVNIIAPTTGTVLKLNESLAVNFTATDPPESGAGTGVTSARSTITSCSGAFTYGLTSSLAITPAPPVAADVAVTATTSVAPWLYVGNFTLTAEADDGAGHTGSAIATFSSGVNVGTLPPISVPNRQFNAGSTLPIKFVLRDGAGELLPPMDGLVVRITAPDATFEERVAGSGAANVRWESDEYGMVTQYITNYAIPATGTYLVEIMVGDVCGAAAKQGSFNFVAASKGGKQ
jgi:hypothetical protein